MAIYIKSEAEIEIMQKANQIVARVLRTVKEYAKPGVSTLDLDQIAEEMTIKAGAKPAFKGYQGSGPYPFPATLCTSINEEIVHGIPSSKRKLKEGDLLSVDFGVVIDGLFGDAAVTMPIGEISENAMKLLMVTKESLDLAIEQAVLPGKRVCDIGAKIEDHVEKKGFSVVRDFVGHGIGRKLHEEPQIPHYRTKSLYNERLRPGMVLAIEPMINEGTWQMETMKDGWTAVTKDGKLSAHFEHSVAVGSDGPVVLSQLNEGEAV